MEPSGGGEYRPGQHPPAQAQPGYGFLPQPPNMMYTQPMPHMSFGNPSMFVPEYHGVSNHGVWSSGGFAPTAFVTSSGNVLSNIGHQDNSGWQSHNNQMAAAAPPTFLYQQPPPAMHPAPVPMSSSAPVGHPGQQNYSAPLLSAPPPPMPVLSAPAPPTVTFKGQAAQQEQANGNYLATITPAVTATPSATTPSASQPMPSNPPAQATSAPIVSLPSVDRLSIKSEPVVTAPSSKKPSSFSWAAVASQPKVDAPTPAPETTAAPATLTPENGPTQPARRKPAGGKAWGNATSGAAAVASSQGPVSTAAANGQAPRGGNRPRRVRYSRKPGDGSLYRIPTDMLQYVEHSDTSYNDPAFDANPKFARFFIIKSYSEDDVHKSVKFNIWTSTEHGNKRLSEALRRDGKKGPIYLLYSVNGSGHFCGVAQMLTVCDFDKMSGCWGQAKWKGEFKVKWVLAKDVPNALFKHITLASNDNKQVTHSRDTQEVPYAEGKQVLKIIAGHNATSSIFDEFEHHERAWEKKKSQMAAESQ